MNRGICEEAFFFMTFENTLCKLVRANDNIKFRNLSRGRQHLTGRENGSKEKVCVWDCSILCIRRIEYNMKSGHGVASANFISYFQRSLILLYETLPSLLLRPFLPATDKAAPTWDRNSQKIIIILARQASNKKINVCLFLSLRYFWMKKFKHDYVSAFHNFSLVA